jgi:hypothetical protein
MTVMVLAKGVQSQKTKVQRKGYQFTMNMRKRMMTYSLTKKNSKADGSKEIGSGFKVQGSKSIVLKGGYKYLPKSCV